MLDLKHKVTAKYVTGVIHSGFSENRSYLQALPAGGKIYRDIGHSAYIRTKHGRTLNLSLFAAHENESVRSDISLSIAEYSATTNVRSSKNTCT